MMLYCHFQIKPLNKIGYTFTWRDGLSSMNSELTILEADNHSDVYLISQTSKMIFEADRIVCFFDAIDDENFGTLARVLEALRKTEKPKLVIIQGENQKLEKSLKMLNEVPLKFENDDRLMEDLSDFFKA